MFDFVHTSGARRREMQNFKGPLTESGAEPSGAAVPPFQIVGQYFRTGLEDDAIRSSRASKSEIKASTVVSGHSLWTASIVGRSGALIFQVVSGDRRDYGVLEPHVGDGLRYVLGSFGSRGSGRPVVTSQKPQRRVQSRP